MTKHLQTIALVFAFALASSAIVRTQEKPAAPAAKPAPVEGPKTPLKVQVLISRYQGEKKLSGLPYTLSVNADSRATLRMGAKVPVMMTMTVGQTAQPRVVAKFEGPLPAPIAKGTRVGTAAVTTPDGRTREYPLEAGADVPKLGVVGRIAVIARHYLFGWLS